jgi:hypothetical protein
MLPHLQALLTESDDVLAQVYPQVYADFLKLYPGSRLSILDGLTHRDSIRVMIEVISKIAWLQDRSKASQDALQDLTSKVQTIFSGIHHE